MKKKKKSFFKSIIQEVQKKKLSRPENFFGQTKTNKKRILNSSLRKKT